MKPSIPKGTRDFLPNEVYKRNFIFDTIKTVFTKYGYQPIETPTMESLDTLTGKYGEEGDKLLFKVLNNGDFLTTFQEKQMSTQPDFILEYAKYLQQHFESQGHKNIEIYVDSYVALNGRSSERYIDPKVDLLKQTESFKTKNWILPFKDEIKGL